MTAVREARPSMARLHKPYRSKRRRQAHSAAIIQEIFISDADAGRSEARGDTCDRRLGGACPQTWWP